MEAQGVSAQVTELLNSDELVRHAKVLAGHAVLMNARGDNGLLKVLKGHQAVIAQTHRVVSEALLEHRKITPAAVWLLDNDYVLQEHVELTRRHLPSSYSKQLPRLIAGQYAGLPRVYELAAELVLRVDGRLDFQDLSRFVEAYQSVATLKLGELWAVPIMLRLALIGKAREVARRVALRQTQHVQAAQWAGQFIDMAHKEPKRVVILLAELIKTQPRLDGPFVAELASRLQGQHAAIGSVLNWLEHELIDRGDSLEALLQRESQEISANQVSISNCFASFRLLETVDWRDFVEAQSVVEKWLREDPSGTYAKMDFYTRDRYRHVVEDISKRCNMAEPDVAQRAVMLAVRGGKTGASDPQPGPLAEGDGIGVDAGRLGHVGWYLLDEGRVELEREVGYWPGFAERLRRMGKRVGQGTYILAAGLMTVMMTAACVEYARFLGATWPVLIVLGLLTLLLGSQTALSLVNWLVTMVVRPEALARMDYSKGIPKESTTLVVVPNMLSSRASVISMVEALEVRYLANREANIKFVLLTDFVDAPHEVMPDDEVLLNLAVEKIAGLNERYKETGIGFYLLHRPRLWNKCEGCWMGYERKRGKVEAFDRYVMTGEMEAFSTVTPGADALRGARYVIVLDADTQLAPQAAAKLAGTMAHPLNRAVVDSKCNRVVRGYGLLQPRVSLSLANAGKSLYSRLFTMDCGLDPYSREVSDVYQDLYGEGSFVGKGILDVQAFHACTSARFPENAILSHDLIEGAFARAGLVSDIELMEDAPTRYTADVARRHRWIRGDWQIARWIMPSCPNHKGEGEPNGLGYLSRWKILDNMRRSLLPLGGIGLVCLGLMALPHPMEWVAIALGFLFMPSIIRSVHLVMATEVRQPVKRTIQRQAVEIVHGLLGLMFMPYEALTSLSAIAKVMWRKTVTGRGLLEWQTSAAAEKSARTDFPGVLKAMWVCPAAGLAMVAVAIGWDEAAIPALVLGACWAAAPVMAWWLSKPLPEASMLLTEDEKTFLRGVARRSWFFFESYTSEQTNWLAPDNYQEKPAALLAERTSPTNIGLGLLSAVGAWDLGYATADATVKHVERAFTTMEKMERYRGHFLNWYDTRTLAALEPKYVSTVDSGNLAGCLMVLSAGLREMAGRPLIPENWAVGVGDTLSVLEEELDKDGPGKAYEPAQVRRLISKARSLLVCDSTMRGVCEAVIGDLVKTAGQIKAMRLEADLGRWAAALEKQCTDLEAQLKAIRMAESLSDAQTGLMTRVLHAGGADARTVKYFETIARRVPTLKEAAELESRFASVEKVLRDAAWGREAGTGIAQWVENLGAAARGVSEDAQRRLVSIEALAASAEAKAHMDFAFLFDDKRKQFAIGFHPDHQRLDVSHYDFLASEARIASYVAVAQGQIPIEHWFMLGRRLANAGGGMALTSWSGSMFEYLMPDLIMPTYPGTLLHESSLHAVKEQVRYANERGVPWGISESGYNLVDSQLQYQYKAFGLPTLGFKRGLSEELVIAPYAGVMGVMALPSEATKNLTRMKKLGFMGTAGFYEAVDFTRSRVPYGKDFAVVTSYMAHHTGMSLLALVSKLNDKPMQRRFLAVPELRAMQLLLQERVPVTTASWTSRELDAKTDEEAGDEEREATIETYGRPDPVAPHVALLGNSRYHVMLTETGGGVSYWQDLALTRWQKDRTVQNAGSVIYVRDAESKAYWSYAYHPTVKRPDYYQATFLQGKAEYVRVDEQIETHTQVAVSPDDDVEVRRVRVTNLSHVVRTLEVTSYVEVVLAKPAADLAHRAFSNLFVQSELVEASEALLLTRRARAHDEKPAWMFHLMPGNQERWGKATFETDREKFIGRGRAPSKPRAVEAGGALSNTTGAVLDPVAAIRRTVTLAPGESAEVDFVLGAGVDRTTVQALVDRYREKRFADRIFESAWTHSQVVQQQLGIGIADVMLFRRLAAALVFGEPSLKAPAGALTRNRRGQQGLWGHGISGDLPMVFVTVSDTAGLELAGKLIQAHGWWRRKGLKSDLVLLVEERGGYRQDLMSSVTGLVLASMEAAMIDKPGGVMVRNVQTVSEEDRLLFQAVADVWLTDRAGSLREQASKYNVPAGWTEKFEPRRSDRRPQEPVSLERQGLQFFNGTGGFTQDGKEYVIRLKPGKNTPSPWANVLANGAFGTVVTESGAGYTWFENAHEYRLTPWHNDPVSDTSGEALYVRDEETGRFWSPMPGPARGRGDYLCRHGLGYSVYEHQESQVHSEVTVYVAFDAPVKFYLVKLRNTGDTAKRVSAWACFDWVLGESRHKTQTHVVTKIDMRTGAALASNPFNAEMGTWTAFAACHAQERSFTGDRAEFYGRSGSRSEPACMGRTRLSNKVGPGLDPCAGFQCTVEIPAGGEREVVFVLGAGHNEREALEALAKYRGNEGAKAALAAVWKFWDGMLGAVRVETPEPALDVMLNNWVVYQTLACRLWARSGFYQSGGAYGFRDQLQDAMALVHTAPWLLREQVLTCASRQFKEGDVQHWWHPPGGQGVRTHFSDDYLWLPYGVARYVLSTHDTGVLDQEVGFLEGRAVKAEEEAYYERPSMSDQRASLYEHCLRSLRHAKRWGVHGLPLIGCGDWNDGMNRIGAEGKGESVWLAFFLHDVAKQFARVAKMRNDSAVVRECEEIQEHLAKNIEANAWDGKWYRRAYFDDGTPVGSAQNEECQIDSIAQSWAVISGAGSPERAYEAMKSLSERLMRDDLKVIQLFTPAFDKSSVDPGYIKGYLPGVRENGAQYTHAAVWAAMAFAKQGDTQKLWQAFRYLNPIYHAVSTEEVAQYRVEPYVIAADIYTNPQHPGRGGWTWYTGSAGWFYRLMLEDMLGVTLKADRLVFSPRVPSDWRNFKIHYRYRSTMYRIQVHVTGPETTRVHMVTRDGEKMEGEELVMVDDGREHAVEVVVG